MFLSFCRVFTNGLGLISGIQVAGDFTIWPGPYKRQQVPHNFQLWEAGIRDFTGLRHQTTPRYLKEDLKVTQTAWHTWVIFRGDVKLGLFQA